MKDSLLLRGDRAKKRKSDKVVVTLLTITVICTVLLNIVSYFVS